MNTDNEIRYEKPSLEVLDIQVEASILGGSDTETYGIDWVPGQTGSHWD